MPATKPHHALSHAIDALRLVRTAAPGWTALSIGLSVFQGLLPVATVYLTKLIVDAVTSALGSANPTAGFPSIVGLLLLVALIVLLANLARSLVTVTGEALAQSVTDYVADLIHERSVAVSLSYYDDPYYYDILHRTQQEAPSRPVRLVSDLLTATQGLISLGALATLLLTLHWLAGVLVFIAVLPASYIRVRYSRLLHRWTIERTQMERAAWYHHWLMTDRSHAPELRLLGLGAFLRERFVSLRAALREERITLARRRALAESGAGLLAALSLAGTFSYLVWQTLAGIISLGSMVMYYQAFQSALGALQKLLGGLAGLHENTLFLGSLRLFLQLDPSPPVLSSQNPVPSDTEGSITLDHVGFTYPDADRPALADVSLAIQPRAITAIVGPNGSGKTTLVKLLCRLYEPATGVIRLDGADIASIDPPVLRERLSVVMQDFTRYQMTVRDSIRIGAVGQAAGDDAVALAATVSGAAEVIARLGDGYDTQLGRLFDNGEDLSTGEWHRLALSRGFVRGSSIYIFDEPTATLDAEAERRILAALRLLAKEHTVVLISHKPSTVRIADHVYVLDGGHLVEAGTHAELLRRDGFYARIHSPAQA